MTLRSLISTFVFFVIAATLPLPFQAEITGLAKFNPTGNDFVSTCSDVDSNVYHSGMCIAFIQGVLEGAIVGAASNAPTRSDGTKLLVGLPCLPDGITNSQMVKVVLRYADKNPEGLQYGAAGLVVRSLSAAWGTASAQNPCANP
jgi:hypothetical protein